MTSIFAAKTPTNESVARRIGLTNAGVSRIRRGNRIPSNSRMRLIEAEYGWSIVDQYMAKRGGTYAAEFEAILKSDDAKA